MNIEELFDLLGGEDNEMEVVDEQGNAITGIKISNGKVVLEVET